MIFAEVLKSALFGVFNYSGRADRLELWTFYLLMVVYGFVSWTLMHSMNPGLPFFLCNLLFSTWLSLAYVALWVRRLHDHDLTGFLVLLPMVPYTLLYFSFLIAIEYIDVFGSKSDEVAWYMMWSGLAFLLVQKMWFLMLFISPGTDGENRYGDPV